MGLKKASSTPSVDFSSKVTASAAVPSIPSIDSFTPKISASSSTPELDAMLKKASSTPSVDFSSKITASAASSALDALTAKINSPTSFTATSTPTYTVSTPSHEAFMSKISASSSSSPALDALTSKINAPVSLASASSTPSTPAVDRLAKLASTIAQ